MRGNIFWVWNGVNRIQGIIKQGGNGLPEYFHS